MLRLRDGIVELYRKVATSIPPDVEEALKGASVQEHNSAGRKSLTAVLENVRKSRQAPRPACIDTGIPFFRVKVPKGLAHAEIMSTIREATVIATQKVPLALNAVDVLTGENSGDNTGIGFPVVYFEEAIDNTLTVDLMLRAGECENYGRTYNLPSEALQADRNLEGAKKCIIDCVMKAEGKGCPPYTIGVGIGASHAQVSVLAVHQLFRKISDESEHPVLRDMEKSLVPEINRLGIGPLGAGGKTTVLAVKIGVNHRHPESYLVHVSLACWANRRGRLIW